jgi:hypothetical protein
VAGSKKTKKFASIDDFEEYLAQSTRDRFNRRHVFSSGNYAALLDALMVAVEDVPEDAEPNAPVTVPLWVADGLLDCLKRYVRTAKTKQKKGPNTQWVKRFRQDLIDWERYQQVWFRVIARRNDDADAPARAEARKWRRWFHDYQRKRGSEYVVATQTPYPWTAGKHRNDWSVFEAVAKTFPSGVYGGSATEMKKSYERVTRALRCGESWRYYPSKWIRFEGQIRTAEEDHAR